METVNAEVLANVRETGSVYRLSLVYDSRGRAPQAARFLTLRFDAPGPHIVPRPFSISDLTVGPDGRAATEILYKPLGRFTSALSDQM